MVDIESSILNSVKKQIGISPEYTIFDPDIILDINTIFMILWQIGVGPPTPFYISDDSALWTDFLGSATNQEGVKTYVYMRVKLMFDPPTSSALMDAMNKTVSELEFRLLIANEPKEGNVL